MTFSIKPNIVSGEESLEIIKNLKSSKVLIVCDPFLKDNGMYRTVTNCLDKDSDYLLYTGVKPDPSQELVDEAISQFLSYMPDSVIAFGGGSAIDLVKSMIFGLVKKNNLTKPTFIAIPTTAGTGSEVTNFAVVTEGKDKKVLIDDLLLPDYALLVPSVTKSVPNFITADTGMDVLTHALEAYMSTASNSFTDVFAIGAIKLVFDNLKIVYEDGLRMKSRKAMLEASCMAGMAFTNAGLGITHSLAHTLGGRFHIAHGRLNAILLPYIIEFNCTRSSECANKLNLLAKDLGLNNCQELLTKIKSLISELNIPNCLSKLNKIDSNEYRNYIEEMAEIAMNDRCTPTNPGYLTKFDLRNILMDVF